MNGPPTDQAESRARLETWLWLAQRASAALLAGFVLVHLVTLVIVVRGGLDAAGILARVGGSAGWLTFYLLFVLAAAVHAPIGVRTVLRESTSLSEAALDALALVMATLLLGAGASAVFSLYAGAS